MKFWDLKIKESYLVNYKGVMNQECREHITTAVLPPNTLVKVTWVGPPLYQTEKNINYFNLQTENYQPFSNIYAIIAAKPK